MSETRISAGINGLDEVLNGGLMPASSYLIVGGAGTGKTILGLQFLRHSAGQKARCLLITLAEPEETLRRNAAAFGWDLSGVTIVDLSQELSEGQPEGEYSVFPPSEVEAVPLWGHIRQAVEKYKPERLVIDSATFLQYLSRDIYQFHRQIQALLNELMARQCLSLLLYEPTELQKDNALALAVDGILTLRNELSQNRVVDIRTVEVNKLRGSAFMSGRHPLRITDQGIVVWPHRIEKVKSYSHKAEVLHSGIAALDEMLGGGLPVGGCTLISGPTGTGKTTLALQFLVTAAAEGRKGVYYTFEEGLASMLERCNTLAIPLEKHLHDGSLVVREISPLDRYPDEFLELLRQDLEAGAEVFALDSLRGYNLAMEAFGSLTAHMQNIVYYVRQKGASLFAINEQENLTGDLQITDLGVSYLSDNVLLVRFAEAQGRLIRVINCLKKRRGNFQPDLRELKLTTQGLQIGEKLEHLRGVLTGVPVSDKE